MPITRSANSVAAGTVAHFAANSPPPGWLKANGQAVSRTTYAALFAAIGTTYGVGNGTTTFNVPDLRGEFVRGWDDGRGVDSGRGIGTSQADQLKDHTHNINVHGEVSSGINPMRSNGAASAVYTTGGASNGGPETRPRNVAMLACIKF